MRPTNQTTAKKNKTPRRKPAVTPPLRDAEAKEYGDIDILL